MTEPVKSKLDLLGVAAVALTLSLAIAPTYAGGKDRDKDDDNDRDVAYAEIYGCRDEGLLGRAVLVERPSDQGVKTVAVSIKVHGLAPGMHAVHIHETGQCEPCGAAGGHFDPGPNSNPSPDGNHPFHMGDLVNINVKRNGKGKLKVPTTRITLSPGPLSVFDADGSAFIIHDLDDTFCPDGPEDDCAGGLRAACGIIYSM